jgi:ribulose-phosphate 3-epimerase
MVQQPEEWLEKLSEAGVDRVILHAESVDNLARVVKKALAMDFDVGVALNPETPASVVDPVAKEIQEVLVMTVEPGAAGQVFLSGPLQKVKSLRKKYPSLHIGVDGGVSRDNIAAAKQAGADRFCINSAIFANPEPADAFALLLSEIT